MNPDPIIREAALTLQSVAPAMPRRSQLDTELSDLKAATARGYFTPEEELRLQDVFARYLSVRAALHQTVSNLEPIWWGNLNPSREQRLQAFAVGFCAACMLNRSARFMVDHCSSEKVLWKKLNDPIPIYGVPRRQFTNIYRSLTRPRNLIRFYMALRYAESRWDRIRELASLPHMAPVVEMLEAERPYIEDGGTYYADRVVKYNLHAVRRRPESGYRQVMFGLFKVSGCAIAEIRNPLHVKRVSSDIRNELEALMQPGDVLITRHDDAASNLFLPGFWPHGALYIGTAEERAALGLEVDPVRLERAADPIRILEAKKDGVLFRQTDETLAVDACTVIRPNLDSADIARGLARAMRHEGKLYDFEFDFSRSDRMVCTEVIYRGFDGLGDIEFRLKERAGRLCFSAEDLLDHAVDRNDYDVIALYGVGDNSLSLGDEARARLVESYK